MLRRVGSDSGALGAECPIHGPCIWHMAIVPPVEGGSVHFIRNIGKHRGFKSLKAAWLAPEAAQCTDRYS